MKRFKVMRNGIGWKIIHNQTGAWFGPWQDRDQAKAVADQLAVMMDSFSGGDCLAYDNLAIATQEAKRLLNGKESQASLVSFAQLRALAVVRPIAPPRLNDDFEDEPLKVKKGRKKK